MDSTERGQLFADQERQGRDVAEQQNEAQRIGKLLSEIGNALQKEPEKVRFLIAKDSIKQTGSELPESLCFNTEKFPTWLELQQLTQNLRDSQQTLQHTKTRLGTQETSLS